MAVQRLLEAKALVDAKETTFGASNDQGNVRKHGILALKVDGMLMVRVLLVEMLFVFIVIMESMESAPEDFVSILCCSLSLNIYI